MLRFESLIALMAAVVASISPQLGAQTPDYQRDVRPILAEHCFQCHGLDESSRQAQLRLDNFSSATHPLPSGATAVVVGQPAKSALIERVTTQDQQTRMPPLETGKSLTLQQISTLQQWIASGARYAEHWSFTPPTSQPLPTLRNASWPKNFIDAFVLSHLEKAGLTPSAEASPERLLRRVSLDLIGVPPTPEEVDSFLSEWDKQPDAAYTRAVDRLLSSPHFGEKMAIDWLDAARYADTNGYFGDRARQAWPWRDWVIQAFNRNQPFDEFTTEQIAGDLLPKASRDQIVATGFHRNSMANNETGIIDEEYRVEAVADRIDTVATVWLGLTVACAQCHNHKYDPITQTEYYQLFAYFNNLEENGLVTKDDPPPTIEVPTDEQLAELNEKTRRLAEIEKNYQPIAAEVDRQVAQWELTLPNSLNPPPTDAQVEFNFESTSTTSSGTSSADAGTPLANVQTSVSHVQFIGTSLQSERGVQGQGAKFDATQHIELSSDWDVDRPWTISVWVKPSGSLSCIWSKIEPTDRRRGVELLWQKGRLQLNLVHQWGNDEILLATRDAMPTATWHHLLVSYAGDRHAAGVRVYVDGRSATLNTLRDTLSGSLACAQPLRVGRRDSGLGYYGALDEFRILARSTDEHVAKSWTDSELLLGILKREKADRLSSESQALTDFFIANEATPEIRQAHSELQVAKRQQRAARGAIATTLVMQERKEPRSTFVLLRGVYDARGEEVKPAVPAVLASTGVATRPDRLGLAQWLTSKDHPLTARVAVNRFWQICFGEGLVRTPNDFGTQGESPTHPELLDELSLRWMQSGWDMKQLLRWIVTSATYRQSSQGTAESLKKDPENRWLSRGPRFRLSAELVRDQALAVSGLWATKVGGPSVRPYQPEGVWEAVSYNAEDSYQPDRGEGLWRRSLYTYWKRQAPPPALQVFDAGTREKCLIKRARTNTPLQALVLLNDPTYLTAASALASKSLSQFSTKDQRISAMFRQVLSRWPESLELQALSDLHDREIAILKNDPQLVQELTSVTVTGATITGSTTTNRTTIHRSAGSPALDLAAFTLVAHTIMNLDEAITRR